jgi:hypothetical protein
VTVCVCVCVCVFTDVHMYGICSTFVCTDATPESAGH